MKGVILRFAQMDTMYMMVWTGTDLGMGAPKLNCVLKAFLFALNTIDSFLECLNYNVIGVCDDG